jgi:hypothetical protein
MYSATILLRRFSEIVPIQREVAPETKRRLAVVAALDDVLREAWNSVPRLAWHAVDIEGNQIMTLTQSHAAHRLPKIAGLPRYSYRRD